MIDGYLSDDEGINSDDVEQGKSENKAAENYNLKFEKNCSRFRIKKINLISMNTMEIILRPMLIIVKLLRFARNQAL